eukprot:1379758-Prymnesium_polylepis.1
MKSNTRPCAAELRATTAPIKQSSMPIKSNQPRTIGPSRNRAEQGSARLAAPSRSSIKQSEQSSNRAIKQSTFGLSSNQTIGQRAIG